MHACNKEWVNMVTVFPSSPVMHYLQHHIFAGKEVNLRWKTTWCGIAWSLWNVGNNKVFRGKAFNKDEALQKIMFHAWEWLRTYNSSFLYSFSQWSSNPGACIKNRSTLAPTVVWLGFGTALVWFGKANVIRACGGVIRMLCALISAGYVILPLIDKYVHVVGVA